MIGGQTTARGRARREHLLNSALAAFAAHGYRGASMAAIADDVGITLPGLLHHFPSKRALLLGVLEHHETSTRERMAEVAASGGTFADQLMLLAGQHEADPSFIRLFTVLAAESVDPEHPAHDWFVERYERVRGIFVEALEQQQRRGVVAPQVDADHVARLLVAVLDGLEVQYLLEPSDGGISAPLATLLRLLRAP